MTAHHDDDDLPPAIRAAWRGGRIVDDLTSITDRRTEDPGRRTGDAGPSPGGVNPDGWVVRVLVPMLMAAAISAFMSWLVADSTARDAVRDNITQVKTTEQNHFEEVLRRLDLIQRWQDRQDSRRDPR